MTDSPRDLQAEDLYRLLWFMWPDGATVVQLLDGAKGDMDCVSRLESDGRVEHVRREADARPIYRARMA